MAGCLVARYGEELAQELPEIDGFVGMRDPRGLERLLGSARGRPSPAVPALRPSAGPPAPSRHLLSYPGSAYLKVAEGCGNRCTYCAIPLIRGELASRPRAEVVEEVAGLLGAGVRELVLIAQDLGSYGTDRGAAGELPVLLRETARLPGEFWVRCCTSTPTISPKSFWSWPPRIRASCRTSTCPSSTPPRPSCGAWAAAAPRKPTWRCSAASGEALPRAVLRSTFLVGFPGETERGLPRSCWTSRPGRAGLGWASSPTPARRAPRPTTCPRVRARTAEERKRELERAQLPITAAAAGAAPRARSWTCWSRSRCRARPWRWGGRTCRPPRWTAWWW